MRTSTADSVVARNIRFDIHRLRVGGEVAQVRATSMQYEGYRPAVTVSI
jgi:hypothetical protein